MNGKVKSILFKVEIEGRGVVNYDSNDQKYVAYRNSILYSKDRNIQHSNVLFAKKIWTSKENDVNNGKDLDYKLKISGNSLRNAIFSNDSIEFNTKIAHTPNLLHYYMASVPTLLRGGLWTDHNYKRKGPIGIGDAIQSNNAQSSIEIFTKSGVKESQEDTGKSDTSLYYKETVGDITYESRCTIDLKNLQFISCDDLFDRKAFSSDTFEDYVINGEKYIGYKHYLSKSLPMLKNLELGYYMMNGSIIQIPEHGILLDNETVLYLTKELFKRVLSLNINKSTSYAQVKSLKIKFVIDSIDNKFSDSNGWIDINTEGDIDNLSFDAHEFYTKFDAEEANAIREEYVKVFEKTARDKKLEREKNVEEKRTNRKNKKNITETEIDE